jgi:hypothetical protein
MGASSKFCTRCGAPAEGERFCTRCGQPFASEPAPGHAGGARAETEAGPATATAVREAAAPPAPPPAPAEAAPPPPAPGGPRRSWLPVAISASVVVILAVVVAVILIATSGKPSKTRASAQTVRLTNTLLASRQLYAATQQPSYSVLLPAGWTQLTTSASGLTGAVTVQSPVDAGATVTVGQLVRPARTLGAQADALLKAAHSQGGFRQDTSTAIGLVGGRHAWAFAYEANGKSTATYLISSCRHTYAVSATVQPGRVSVLRPRIAIVAGTLQGNC